MKGVIVCSLKEMVTSMTGKEMCDKCQKEAGMDPNALTLPVADIPDAQVMGLVQAVCRNMGLSLEQAADAFGDYWVNVYSQKLYKQYFTQHKTARDLLLAMDRVHVNTTKLMPSAKPPRFEYEWTDAKTLIMRYNSTRGLIDLLVGLVKGVGKYYGETLRVNKMGNDRVKIVFN